MFSNQLRFVEGHYGGPKVFSITHSPQGTPENMVTETSVDFRPSEL